MDCTGKAVAIIRAAQRGQRHAARGGAARRPRTEQWEEGKKGRGTNCMLEEEDQIMKRVRE